MVINFPCVCCKKAVKSNQRGILCTKCKTWVHITCVNISKALYENDDEHFLD